MLALQRQTVLKVLAFDPGVAPAAALYCGPEYAIQFFEPMYTKATGTNTKGKPTSKSWPDRVALLNLIDTANADINGVEDVSTRGGQGIASQGRLMHAAGLIEGMVMGRGKRLAKVLPKIWTGEFRMKADEDASRQYMIRLLPYTAAMLPHKNDHHQADAGMMAIFFWCREMGVPVPRI